MSKIEVILDISNKSLREVPKYVVEMSNLKMLYLEGNQIEVLPDELFTNLKRLVWLDLRRNNLKTLPQSIAYHPCLETLLLRDNDIQRLPTELGLMPKLKVLQVSGNPIHFPPNDILQDGIHAIVSFLRKQYDPQSDVLDTGSCGEPDIKCSVTSKEKELLQNSKENYPQKNKPCLKIKGYYRDNKCTYSHHKLTKSKLSKSNSKCSAVYKDYPSNNDVHARKFDNRIEERLMSDLWRMKLKDIMTLQNEKLQREKDLETLKNWRQRIKHKQNTKAYKREAPFDTNEDYKIPSRKDLSKYMAKSPRLCKLQPKIKSINIDSMISEVIESLQYLGKNKESESTPREQMDKARKDINKIIELQKRLSMLKIAIAKDIKNNVIHK